MTQIASPKNSVDQTYTYVSVFINSFIYASGIFGPPYKYVKLCLKENGGRNERSN